MKPENKGRGNLVELRRATLFGFFKLLGELFLGDKKKKNFLLLGFLHLFA